MNRSIVIGSDHAGFQLKSQLVEHLKKEFNVLDVGVFSEESGDYPDIAKVVCEKVLSGKFECGIVMCGTGIGISISANKINGIRCALCHDHYTAQMCRQHNDANVLAMGGRTTVFENAREMVDTYLRTPFEGGRHKKRVEKIGELEVQSTGKCTCK